MPIKTISAIIPTIGRADSLIQLLKSLTLQSRKPDEVIVADGSNSSVIKQVLTEQCWGESGLSVEHLIVHPPNAVRQRQMAIAASQGDLLLLLDDDVELEPLCVENLLLTLEEQPNAVAVMADFNNQTWSQPATAWRLYMRLFCGLHEGEWQGKVVGPLLRFGYYPSPPVPMAIEWLGAGNSLIRRSAYESAGGFSDFFLHRCTLNEDVDLGLKLSRVGKIYLCPDARLGHFHAPSGRVSPKVAAEDDLYNRYLILHRTLKISNLQAITLVLIYFAVETFSNLLGNFRRRTLEGMSSNFIGRVQALLRIILLSLSS